MNGAVAAGDARTGAAALRVLLDLSPAKLVLLIVAIKAVAWTLAPALTHLAVPLDVAEGYGSGRAWVLATDKHPNLPGLILEMLRLATGATRWPAYAISQLFVAGTFLAVFVLGRDMLGAARAATGTLLLSGIAFYAWPTVEFNHNIAQILLWALVPLAAWRAVETGKLSWWLLLGALAGLSLYAKLSSLLLLAAIAGWILWDSNARRRLATPGPWLAAGLFAVCAAPLASWLVAHNGEPLAYMADRASQQPSLAPFFGGLALNIGGLVALLGIIGLLRPLLKSAQADGRPDRAVVFLSVTTLVPLLLAVAYALVARSGLKSAWSSSMFNYLGVLAVALAGSHATREHLNKAAVAALGLAVLVPLGYAGVVLAGPTRNGIPMRVNWPQEEIAKRFVDLWGRETGLPLRVVGGGPWAADIIAMDAPGAPVVLSRSIHGASDETIAQTGILLVWDARREVPPLVQAIAGDREIRSERFVQKRGRRADDIVVNYVVVPPSGVSTP